MSFTARGHAWPTLTQFSIFLPNRVGALQQLLRTFAVEPIRILGLTMVNAVDCAVVRLILDHPDRARRMLREGGFSGLESSLLAVELPEGEETLQQVCASLLQGEVNLDYLYPLIRPPAAAACVVLCVDAPAEAAEILQGGGFRLLDEVDLLG
jgi:hypothetical protein